MSTQDLARLEAALAALDPDRVSREALARARTKIATCRSLVAANELEATLAWGSSPAQRWPLLVALAELYDAVGAPQRAWRAACAARRHAAAARSTRGIAVAERLVAFSGGRP